MAKKVGTDPRKNPVQKRSQETVDVILKAATQILGSIGFDSASTNRIAEKAGISIGSLYQYFPNKESLAGALIDRYVNQHAERFEKMLDETRGGDVPAMIQKVSEQSVEMYLGNRKFLHVLGKVIPKLERVPSVIRVRKKIASRLASELKRRPEIRHPDPDMAAYIILNASMGVIQMILADETMEIEQQKVADELARMALGYLLR